MVLIWEIEKDVQKFIIIFFKKPHLFTYGALLIQRFGAMLSLHLFSSRITDLHPVLNKLTVHFPNHRAKKKIYQNQNTSWFDIMIHEARVDPWEGLAQRTFWACKMGSTHMNLYKS
jgi:hypothetical protein